MRLSDCIAIEEKDIISFVGAGGKTTMMFKLAEELRLNNKVLVTTTTKIYRPSEEKYDFICTNKKRLSKYVDMKEKGIYVLGLGINKENKILGIGEKELDELAPYFDYVLIEADGSKEKQLKGWKESEPVIYGKTTKTVGLIDVQAFGMVINEEKVHRSKIFCKITGAKEGDNVKLEHLTKLIINPLGLFKGAMGKRVLYINKVEEPTHLTLAEQLVKEVTSKNKKLLDKVFIGSLKSNTYF